MGKKVVAIVGSYRKGGIVDRAVEAVLEGARENGAETHTIYLIEQQIEFCTNCRQCAEKPGKERGKCVRHDGLEAILTEIEAADAMVLGSPVNFYNVTALYRRFLERLIGCTYWPPKWAPRARTKLLPRKAVLVASAGMPGFLIPLLTGAARALRISSNLLGAQTIGRLWIGLVASGAHPPLSGNVLKRARLLGMKLD
jgi:multimeric flavodoxin WrbA